MSARQFAPAAARNTEPILGVLRDVLPETGRALEIAGGTGQHAEAFARAFPDIHWQPSDPDAAARDSIGARVAESGLSNMALPLDLDVAAPGWEQAVEPGLDAVLCINMVHISPWTACEGLLRGAGALLKARGLLYLYGPYMRGGEHTAPSNAEFDGFLRDRNPDWGVRDLDAVAETAGTQGLALESIVEMPANNLSVVMRRR